MAGKSKAKSVSFHYTKEKISTHLFLHRTLIVRLISTAQTGFFYTKVRRRLGPKLSAVKYDPVGKKIYVCLLGRKILIMIFSKVKSFVCRSEKEEIDSLSNLLFFLSDAVHCVC